MDVNSRRDDRASPFAWVSTVVITIVVLVCSRNLVQRFVSEPDLSQLKNLLVVRSLGSCAPEPLEQARYVFTIVAFPVLFALAFLVFRRLAPQRLAFLRSAHWTWLPQIALTYFVWLGWKRQDAGIHQYFDSPSEWCAIGLGAIFAGASPLLRQWARPKVSSLGRGVLRLINALSIGAALTLTALYGVSTIFTEKNIGLAFSIVHVHIDHFSEEFAGPLLGKTVLVDYFPQYQNILPALMSPWFRLIGFDTFRFTITMALLSAIGVLIVFRVLWGLTGSALKAFFLFAAFLSAAYYGYLQGPGQVLNSFNYWGIWPMRQFLPYVSFLFLFHSLRRPTLGRIGLTFLVGSVTALNNLEFGIPALVGVWAAHLLAEPEALYANPGRFFKRLLPLAVFCLAATLAVFAVWARIRAGAWPEFGRIVAFQRIFARYGFFAMPGPSFGLHTVIIVTFLGALASALYFHFVPTPTSASREARHRFAGLLAFAAVFGCGSLMYYINRSHPMVLSAVYANWALALVLLFVAWIPLIENWDLRRAFLPRWLLSAPLILFLIYLKKIPDPIAQWQRFHEEDTISTRRRALLREQVEALTTPEEVSYFMIYTGNEIAFRSGRRNLFPFPHPNSILLRDQVILAARPLQDDRVPRIRKIVAVFPRGQENFYSLPELRERIEGLGFRMTSTRPLMETEVTELWERP